MKAWPKYPTIHELNTWVWLGDLNAKYGQVVSLATVPDQEWDAIAAYGVDAVWLMGVWERSPAGVEISMQNAGLLEDFRKALPDFAPVDNVGSPYCVRRYVVDTHLGGPEGLAAARAALAVRDIRLITDFVANHVAPDHPSVTEHPEYFIQGTADDARNDPASFMDVGGRVFALGRDPGYPAWPDVLQLNVFAPGLRRTVVDTLSRIAAQCDGVRCDMAMLVLNDIFERTWGSRAGARPADEYWATLIPAIKAKHPGFKFIAEVYWDLEWQLQQQGCDYCYDKKFFDRATHGTAESIRQHLLADSGYQERLIRFLENHDEPRAAAVFPGEQGRAAAVTLLTLPSARLLYQGQFDGHRVKLPVFLGRRPKEAGDHDLTAFYGQLLRAVDRELFRNGDWRLCQADGWPDNQSYQHVLAWCWDKGDARAITVVNWSNQSAQARIKVPWDEPGGRWRLSDLLSGEQFDRDGSEMREAGLYVDLGPWRYHLFQCTPGP